MPFNNVQHLSFIRQQNYSEGWHWKSHINRVMLSFWHSQNATIHIPMTSLLTFPLNQYSHSYEVTTHSHEVTAHSHDTTTHISMTSLLTFTVCSWSPLPMLSLPSGPKIIGMYSTDPGMVTRTCRTTLLSSLLISVFALKQTKQLYHTNTQSKIFMRD